MVAPQFTKRQVAFLGLGTLLPACFLLLVLLDQTRLAHQASSVSTMQTEVNKAVAASTLSVLGIVSDIQPTKSQLTIEAVSGNTTTHYIVSITKTTKIIDRPTGQNNSTTSYSFKDLSEGDFVAVTGTGQRTSMAATVVEIDRSSLQVSTDQKTIFLPSTSSANGLDTSAYIKAAATRSATPTP